jgi:predicted DNA-binding transcriptional regulator YafY
VPARNANGGELRTFRADRIDGAAIGEPVAPPEPGFDPVAHVVEMLARGPWGWEVEVRLDAPLDELAPRVPPTLAELSPDGAGTRLELRAESLDWAAGFLAGLGFDFEVVHPDELREPLARLADRLTRSAQA